MDNRSATWQGIPIAHLAEVSWWVRDRLLALLAAECAEAAERHRTILAARSTPPIQPDDPEIVARRIRDNGWAADSDDTRRTKHRARMRLKRATSPEQRHRDREAMRRLRARRRAA